AAWLMTSLTTSATLVALVQTATSLPIFLVALPSGAIGDVVDRRKLLLVAQGWMLAVAGVLGILTLLGATTPWVLLFLTFALGLGAAMMLPTWQAIQPELVPREEFPQAVSLGAVSFNLARAVGPALGGLLVAIAGPGAVFLANAASFLAVAIPIYRWHRPADESALPPEHITAAVWSGICYVRHAPPMRAVLIRASVFIFFASALWALLPLLARDQLGLGSGGYGLLLGCVGVGSVLGATVLPGLRRKFSQDTAVASATALLAVAIGALAYVVNIGLAGIAMLVSGVAWIVVLSSLNVSVQTFSPPWVRARALSVYQLIFQGGVAIGSVFFGMVAEWVGTLGALGLAALGLLLGLTSALRWRLFSGEHLDLTPSAHWAEPAVAIEPGPEEGPVLVTIEYRIDPGRGQEFVRVMDRLGRSRRRSGATRWGVFHDAADPSRYLEAFIVGSWVEHLRQHERVSVAEKELQERVHSFLVSDAPPVISHFIAGAPSGAESGGESNNSG
ncbi:MAG TPA: MFS transporter, partial [Rubrobacteraceae bacterium]|nr:MFS transporter [Rubrobacteraceae bacterium]